MNSKENPWASPEEERPWPVYGQSSSGVPPNSQGTGQQTGYNSPSGSAPYGSPGYPNGPGQNSRPSQQPPPGQQSYMAQTPYVGEVGEGGPVQLGKLPSRVGPILGIIGGVLLMLVVAPILFVVMVLQGVGFSPDNVNGFLTSNGAEVAVGESGTVGLMSAEGSNLGECVFEGSGGPHVAEPELDGDLKVGRGLQPGTYSVTCDGVPLGEQLMVLEGNVIDELVPSTMKALGIGSAVGFIGLVTVIASIVWLVKRNRSRREILQGY